MRKVSLIPLPTAEPLTDADPILAEFFVKYAKSALCLPKVSNVLIGFMINLQA